MRLGIVDIGTLSLRFDIYESLPPFEEAHLIHRHRSMPRLGEALCVNPTAGANEKVVDEFKIIASLAAEHGVRYLRAVGTSIFRDITSSTALIASVREKTQIFIEVLSGNEEARLTALGIFANEKNLPPNVALVDIGGGSTEVSLCSSGVIIDSCSVDLGASRLKERFFRQLSAEKPLDNHTAQEVKDFICDHLQLLKGRASLLNLQLAVGSSGTIRMLERLGIESPNEERTLSFATINTFTERLCGLSLNDILLIPRMEANRADVLLPGCLILREILAVLELPLMRVTNFSLRHGILAQILELLRENNGVLPSPGFSS